MSYFMYFQNGTIHSSPIYSLDNLFYNFNSLDNQIDFGALNQYQPYQVYEHSNKQNWHFPIREPIIEVTNRKRQQTQDSQQNQAQKQQHLNQKKSHKDLKSRQKELQSAKKNSESNLVNQFLSYFSSPSNSSQMITKALQKMNLTESCYSSKQFDDIIGFFCKMVSIVNSRRERKYVNKTFLQNYFTIQKLQKYMPDILQKTQNFQKITKKEFCQLFRRCCFNFFRTISVSSVASSAKLNIISRPEHIKRRRLIVQTLGKN